MTVQATQDKARAAILKLIPGAEVGFPGGAQTAENAHIIVTHPKRKLTLNSFANAAKKIGWNRYGTKSATNSNMFIVLYVNVDATMELYVNREINGEVWIDAREANT